MKKVTVFVNRAPVSGPWGGGNNFIKALFDHGKDFDVAFTSDPKEKFDAILMIDPRYDEMGISANEIRQYKIENHTCPVLYRVNECDARKGTNEIDSVIKGMNTFVDEYVFVSTWIEHYFCYQDQEESILIPRKASVIYNGVNKDHFFENENKQKSDKLRVVTHHWSNNYNKGFDIYNELDDVCKNENIEFTYIGRDLGTFRNTAVIAPLSGKDLGAALRDHDLYITASRFDPGPNHCIEAIASGLPILAHYLGGGAVEFAGKENSYHLFDTLMKRIRNKDFAKSKFIVDDWKTCVGKYCETIRMHFER